MREKERGKARVAASIRARLILCKACVGPWIYGGRFAAPARGNCRPAARTFAPLARFPLFPATAAATVTAVAAGSTTAARTCAGEDRDFHRDEVVVAAVV